MKFNMTLLFIILLGTTSVWGQSRAFNPRQSLDNISISQWTTKQGLPSNNTSSVFQDSNGLIWITSFNGFMIYDGERIEIYDKNRLTFLETDGFYAIAEDHKGTIYLATNGDGLIQYKEGVFSRYQSKSSKIPKSIRSLYVASDSSLYLGTNQEGLFKIKNDTATKITNTYFDQSMIRVITEDQDHHIWFGTEGNGLARVNDTEVRNFDISEGLHSHNVISLAVSDGNLYVGTAKGLQWLDSQLVLHDLPSVKNVSINCMLVDDWGMIWAGSEGGLARWNPTTQAVEWLGSKQNIDLVRVNSMIMDAENHIWLSSNRSGLIQIQESKVSNISTPVLSSDRINIIHESWNGNLYFGTDKSIIDVFDGHTYSHIQVRTDLGGNGIRDIYHDTDGSFWLATYIGIVHMKNGEEKLYATATGMPAEDFRTIHKDRNGYFWFCTRSGGVVKFKDGEIVRVYASGQGLDSNFALAISEAENGDIYVGTFNGGMTIIDQEGNTRTYHLNKDDSGLLLFNIDLDSLQNAFVTANQGLLYFDGDSLLPIRLQKDQRSNTFFDLIVDEHEHLWLTTNLGVLQIKKSDWLNYRNEQISELPYFILDKSSGMNTEECTGATRSTKISNGNIYVPTLGGVVVIDPQTIQREVRIPRVMIRHMKADEKSLNIHNDIVYCEPGTSRYRFDFSVLSYSSPDINQFRYKLEGYDSDWSSASYLGTVEYTNLSPGEYTFKVIGTSDGQLWNTTGDAVTFTTLPFFYQTIWFLLLCIGGIALIILLFFRWRVAFINHQNNELRKLNTELDRFVYSASHEMRSPLSSILGLINVAKMDDKSDKIEYLNYIEHSVLRLDELIHDIIDYSKNARLGIEVEPIDLNQTITNILEDISFTDHFSKIRHSLHSNLKSDFHSDGKRLKIVLSNLITNAFKHHAPEQIKDAYVNIDLLKVDKGVLIQISDNGPGIEEEHQKNIFKMFYRATHRSQGSGLGLYIVKETVTNLHGTIELQSKENEGTTFIIRLPDLEKNVK